MINFKSSAKYISRCQVSQDTGVSGKMKLRPRVLLPVPFLCLEWCLKTGNCFVIAEKRLDGNRFPDHGYVLSWLQRRCQGQQDLWQCYTITHTTIQVQEISKATIFLIMSHLVCICVDKKNRVGDWVSFSSLYSSILSILEANNPEEGRLVHGFSLCSFGCVASELVLG